MLLGYATVAASSLYLCFQHCVQLWISTSPTADNHNQHSIQKQRNCQWMMQMLKWPDTFSLNVTTVHLGLIIDGGDTGPPLDSPLRHDKGWKENGVSIQGWWLYNWCLSVNVSYNKSQEFFSLNLRCLNHGLLQFLEVSCRLIPILHYTLTEDITIWQMDPFWCWSLDSVCFRNML